MTIMQAIELANKNAGITSSHFADVLSGEFSRFFESGKTDQYPVNVTVPFTVNGNTGKTGIRHAVIPLQGWMLTQLRGTDPVDYRSKQVEIEYLEPMRKLAAKFLKELLKTNIIDPSAFERGISDSIKPEHMFTDHRLFGVSYSINLPVIQNVC